MLRRAGSYYVTGPAVPAQPAGGQRVQDRVVRVLVVDVQGLGVPVGQVNGAAVAHGVLHTIPADVDRLLGATAEVYNPGDYDGMDGDWSLWADARHSSSRPFNSTATEMIHDAGFDAREIITGPVLVIR